MPVSLYILRRMLLAVPTLLAVSVIGFLLMRFNVTLGPVDLPASPHPIRILERVEIKQPVDPLAELRQNPQISPEAIAKETGRLGLDRPLPEQYWRWLTHVLHVEPQALAEGRPWAFFQPDLGRTFSGEDVAAKIASRAGNTLLLNLTSMLLTWGIAIPLGIFAAMRWRSLADRLLTVFSSVGMAFPSFVLALFAAMFAVKTGWFPLGNLVSDNFDALAPWQQVLDIAHHVALPALVLTVLGIAGLQRQMRATLLDVLDAEYVRTARLKGLPEFLVIYRHALRNAINPMVTMLGYEFAALLGGSVLVETVLGYPGLGLLTYQAALQADTNLVMASLILSAFMLVAGNLFADILLKIVDPRVELQ
jgi:peptide/nickel transport system permease protein